MLAPVAAATGVTGVAQVNKWTSSSFTLASVSASGQGRSKSPQQGTVRPDEHQAIRAGFGEPAEVGPQLGEHHRRNGDGTLTGLTRRVLDDRAALLQLGLRPADSQLAAVGVHVSPSQCREFAKP